MQPGKQLRFSKFFVGLEEKLEDKEKESAPKRRKIDEDTYKEARLKEGLPYVPNGMRDKFGNARKKVGGRPRKADRDKAGVAGGASSNVKKIGDARRRELPAPDALLLIDEIETEYNKRFLPDQDKPSRAQVNAFYNEMAADRPNLKLTNRAGTTLERIALKKQEYKLRAEFLNLGKNRVGRSNGKEVHKRLEICGMHLRIWDIERAEVEGRTTSRSSCSLYRYTPMSKDCEVIILKQMMCFGSSWISWRKEWSCLVSNESTGG